MPQRFFPPYRLRRCGRSTSCTDPFGGNLMQRAHAGCRANPSIGPAADHPSTGVVTPDPSSCRTCLDPSSTACGANPSAPASGGRVRRRGHPGFFGAVRGQRPESRFAVCTGSVRARAARWTSWSSRFGTDLMDCGLAAVTSGRLSECVRGHVTPAVGGVGRWCRCRGDPSGPRFLPHVAGVFPGNFSGCSTLRGVGDFLDPAQAGR